MNISQKHLKKTSIFNIINLAMSDYLLERERERERERELYPYKNQLVEPSTSVDFPIKTHTILSQSKTVFTAFDRAFFISSCSEKGCRAYFALSGSPESIAKGIFTLSGSSECTTTPNFVLSGGSESTTIPKFAFSGSPECKKKMFFQLKTPTAITFYKKNIK